MLKKMTLLAMAVGALLAFSIPAAASAAELTGAKVGDTITATSVNAETTIPGGKILKCKHVAVNGIVTVNSGGVVAVAMDGANDTASECDVDGVGTIVRPTFEGLELEGEAGEAAFSFEVLTAGGFCPVSSAASEVTWTTGTDSVHIVAAVVPGKEGCPGGELHGDFTLTKGGVPLTIH